jgi:hypothetical protein
VVEMMKDPAAMESATKYLEELMTEDEKDVRIDEFYTYIYTHIFVHVYIKWNKVWWDTKYLEELMTEDEKDVRTDK